MKLRLSLARSGQEPVDLSVVYDSSATVGDLAEHLYLADPLAAGRENPPVGLTLAAVGDRQSALGPEVVLADSGLRSGQTVSLARAGERYREAQRPTAAVLKVIDGPDLGQEFALAPGSNVVGRGRDCEVRLTDVMVSRQHVRVNVADSIELVDLGSANGILVNGEPAEREVLQASDQVMVGDTTFTVRPLQSAATEGRVETTAVAFIRSPRLAPIYPGEHKVAPELPERPQPNRLPMFMLIAPLVMAAVMWVMTQQLMSLIFMAMMPLLIVAGHVDETINARRTFKRALKQWRADVDRLCAELAEANQVEAASRLVEHPSVEECMRATADLSSLLWTRRPDMPGFAEFRLGRGTVSARTTIEMPDAKRAPRDLYAELVEALRELRTVDDVPIVVRPANEAGFGVAGPRSLAVAAARSVVVQAASLHSPEELVVAAVASAVTAQDWEWVKWIPHCRGSNSPLSAHLGQSTSGAAAVIASVEELIAERAETQQNADEPIATPAVLLVVESDAPVEFGRLVAVAENGWRHGVFVMWVASDLSALPASCRVFLELRDLEAGRVGFVHVGEEVSPVAVEAVSLEQAHAWARRISPISDLATRSDDASDVPRAVNLLSLRGFDPMLGAETVIERWQANRSIVVGPLAPTPLVGRHGNLRAVIGQSSLGPHSLDLRADGPHALVGGTTGSGKSELLQTWILAMAASHSPQRLNFLLVDYKGGSAFADCNNLPHTVGLVTDLNKNGVRRALTSLAAELHYRERLITEQHRCKDLPTMEKKFPAQAPPSLVIVVDEFAALVQEVPEFIDGVVNVAQRGRSLGLHMILATQQPSGVIKGALRANTNLRLALRVADVDDSNDVLGSPQAAFFDQDTPGRAVSKTGPGRMVPFQTGYVGGHSGAGPQRAEILVEELRFGSGAVWEVPADDDESPVDRGPADISRIVSAVNGASARAELPPPRKPWLPDLARSYDLAVDVPTRRSDTELVFGILDDPAHQRQVPVAFRPDVEGNVMIFGASGSGKTTLLRTLAVAAGFTVRGGPCHVYALDFASRGLDMLECLPHVGSVINGSDDERVARLLNWLHSEVIRRSAAFGQVTASNITEYRQLAKAPDEPRIVVLIDGIAAFRSAYESVAKAKYWDLLGEIAAQGRAVGIHFVIASDQRGGLSAALAASIQRKVVMRMADVEEYGMIGVPATILSADSPPGRCIVDDAEVQVAVLGSDSDASSQAAALEKFGAAMRKTQLSSAMPIQRLPQLVERSDIGTEPGLVSLGMVSEDFATAVIRPQGPFIVTGPTGSGRSQAMELLAAELRRLGIPVHLLSDRRSELTATGPWASVAVGGEQVSGAIDALTQELAAASERGQVHAVFLEGMGELASTEAEYAMSGLIRSALTGDHFVVGEGEVNSLGQAYDAMKRFKAGRRGLVLQPDDDMGSVVQTSFPRCQSSDFCPGRGFLVERGVPRLIQVARM